MLATFTNLLSNKQLNDKAIIGPKGELTFVELDRLSNQFASYLKQTYNLQKGDRIIFSFSRSTEAIISLLSIIKLGCTYVPVVAEFGKQRIQYIINQTEPKLIVGNKDLEIFESISTPLYLANSLMDDISSVSHDFSISPIEDRDPFCILFTSGSTGNPKGVLLNHHAFHNRIEWMKEAYPFLPNEDCFQNTRFTTVDSIWEIFCPLYSGRPLVIIDDCTIADPNRLVPALNQYNIFRITLVPSMLEMILETHPNLEVSLPRLKMWVTSGESLLKGLCVKFYASHPGAKLYNFYGLTESSSDISHFDTSPFFESGRATQAFDKLDIIPIGSPIRNTHFLLRNAEGEISDQLEKGELCVAGDSLSPGYLGGGELDSQKYSTETVDINGEKRKARVLKTSDYVTKSKENIFTLTGRIDDLINIRGYKIYPLEIETSIRKIDFISKCKIVRTDNNQALNLYYTCNTFEEQPAESRRSVLYRHCQECLPSFMIPKHFIELETFPSTATGKMDTKVLPEPTHEHLIKNSSDIYKTAEGKTQQTLVTIWASILTLDEGQISADDNFFQLGGNSLLVAQLRSRIKSTLNVTLPMADIFLKPKLSELASHIDMADHKQVKEFSKTENTDGIPLSHSQERIWYLQQLHGDSVVNNIPFSYILSGEINVNALEQAFNEILKRHDILRTNIKPSLHGSATQTIQPIAKKRFYLKFTDLRREKDPMETALCTRRRFVMEPFDLTQGQLLRSHLMQTKDNQFVLSIVIHHIVADYWSLGILIREISCLYNSIITGENSGLPPVRIEYQDYIRWQCDWFQDEVKREKLEFWKNELEGLPQLSSIVKAGKPQVKMPRITDMHRLYIDAQLAIRLKKLRKDYGVSFFMTMLALTKLTLWRKTNQNEQVVGSPIANRLHEETEGTVGVFVNVMALKTLINPEMSFLQFLHQIRSHMLEVYKHQDMPYEKLMDELFSHQRVVDYHPLFQVMLISQDYEPVEFEFSDVTSEFIHNDFPVTKFDLTFMTTELKSGGINIDLIYEPKLFSSKEIQEMSDTFLELLEFGLTNPQTRLSTLGRQQHIV